MFVRLSLAHSFESHSFAIRCGGKGSRISLFLCEPPAMIHIGEPGEIHPRYSLLLPASLC